MGGPPLVFGIFEGHNAEILPMSFDFSENPCYSSLAKSLSYIPFPQIDEKNTMAFFYPLIT